MIRLDPRSRSRWGRTPHPPWPSRWTLAALASASLIAALSLVQCTRSASAEAGGTSGECTCAGAPVVDGTLLAFLSKARAAHHRADLTQEEGDTDLAIASLRPVVSDPHPSAPEALEVVADTYARLADLESDLGDTDRAMRDVEAGLALATSPTHFRGHLLEIKGVVLERRYRVLEASGETTEAARVKGEALEAFHNAIEVQDQVINDALQHVGR